jgi:excisionase family DNA binding protein
VKREVETEWPVFLTVEEAASLLRLKRSHAYELVKKGVIPAVRLGRFIRIPRERLMRMGFPKEYEAGGAKG